MIKNSDRIFLDIQNNGLIVFGGYINFTSKTDDIKDVRFKVSGESKVSSEVDNFYVNSSYTYLKDLVADDNNLYIFGTLNDDETDGFFKNEYSSIAISYIIEMNDGTLYEGDFLQYELGDLYSESDGYVNRNTLEVNEGSSVF